MNDVLRIQNLSKRFDRTQALADVSFSVPAGSIFGLLGPNGAGKTTLFSIVAGFLGADSGSLRVLDTDVANIAQLQGRMTILPQDAAFQRNVPIMEQLMFLRRLDGSDRVTAEREVHEALAMVGLGQHAKRGVHALSHGMQKRLGIAQAFLGRPDVILLDEPTSGLDPQNARQIRDLVKDMQRSRQATTVISSHNLAEIQELCDHVAILDKGRLLVAGSVDEITRQSRRLDVVMAQPLSAAERARLTAVACIGSIDEMAPARYRLTLRVGAGEADPVRAAMQAVLALDTAPRSMIEGSSLEDVFLAMTGSPGAPPNSKS